MYTNLRQLAGGVFDEFAEDALFVVANQDDFLYTRNPGDGTEAVPDYGVAGYVEKRLEEDVNVMPFGSLRRLQTFGTSSDNGLKRVPLEGPPTYRSSELGI